ncbi:hypothetical protein KIL84_021809 [Mauremys mutica]|uniref:Uncharacterized protein n=1 Tax=Mauremys mutica TaxID=74926 RepID=A0A9D3XGJ5_9SAUR|nr:hypothetical protein KIL84_021809 [Mauremys mutica]
MKTKLETPGLCQAEAGSPRLGSIRSVLLSRVKCLLQPHKLGVRLASTEQGRACLEPDSSKPGSCPWKKLLIALGIMITIALMVLLLLWHYKCIVIDRYCEGNREVLPPLFKILQRKGT